MFSEAGWQQAQEAVRHPLGYQIAGCSFTERGGNLTWRWCGGRGTIVIDNRSRTTRVVKMNADLIGGTLAPSHVTVDGPGILDRYVASASTVVHFAETVRAGPGRTTLRFSSDGKPLIAPDPRSLVMRFQNLTMDVIDQPKLETSWASGCYPLERDAYTSWHWCSASAELVFRNLSSSNLSIPFRLGLAGGFINNTSSMVRIEGPGFSDKQTVTSSPTIYRHSLVVPPGEVRVRFSSDGKRIEVPPDTRVLVFRVIDFRVENPVLETRLIEE